METEIVTLRMDRELAARLKGYALLDMRTLNSFVVKLIHDALEERKRQAIRAKLKRS